MCSNALELFIRKWLLWLWLLVSVCPMAHFIDNSCVAVQHKSPVWDYNASFVFMCCTSKFGNAHFSSLKLGS